jgi:hypothetical protein
LLDGHRQGSKTAWLLGGLSPLTLGLAALIYGTTRPPHRQLARNRPAAASRLGAGTLMIVTSATAMLRSPLTEGDEVARHRRALEAHSARLQAISALSDPFERAVARKALGITYENDLRAVPKSHTRYRDAQRELVPFDVQRAREKADAFAAAKKAEAARVPKYRVVQTWDAGRGVIAARVAVLEPSLDANRLANLMRHVLIQYDNCHSVQVFGSLEAAQAVPVYRIRADEPPRGLIGDYDDGCLTYHPPGGKPPRTIPFDR